MASSSTTQDRVLSRANHLAGVRYEIRGPLAQRALQLEREGHEILKLNIGNPAQFGFRAPDSVRLAIIDNLSKAEGYSHQKGIMPAREAVVAETLSRGIAGVTVDDVFMGNGVSELILMCMEGLLDEGDEVLVPSPDYPLWTAAVTLTGARAVHYPCRPENGFVPDASELAQLITPRTRALVLINPNNPTGAVYPRASLEALARLATERGLVVFADEIYDRIVYDGAEHVPMATLVDGTLCATFGGLSKVHRACGIRAGWVVFSGDKRQSADYIEGLELLSSLRLCANVPGQWAVPAALSGHQSIHDLTSETGRLGKQRRAVLRGVEASPYLKLVAPMGALYAFASVDTARVPTFSDRAFAFDLLEREHVLIVPGSGFNVPYHDHFRLTLLPNEEVMQELFVRLDRRLSDWATRR